MAKPTAPTERKAAGMAWSLDDIDDDTDLPTSKDLPPIPIDPDTFPAAFATLKAQVGEGRPSLQGILQALTPRVEGHVVIAPVGNTTMEGQLNQHRDAILEALRALLQNPTVVFRIEVDETLVPEVRTARMSLEETHEKMLALNPALAELERAFKTTLDG